MKLPWLALLSVGTAAFCQAPAQRPVNPDKLFQMPDRFAENPRWDKLPQRPFVWNKSILPPPNIVSPRPRLNNPQIDPKIIVRPPWQNQPKGHDFARHLYPNLKFLPLQRPPRNQR